MANEQQFKVSTTFVAVRTARDYRASVEEWGTERDSVLELGCETGTLTELLAQRAADVIAVDTSRDAVNKARLLHPDLRFEVIDAADTRAVLQLGSRFDTIYFDVAAFAGYSALLDIVALLTSYATLFTPKTIVVKSATLAKLSDQSVAWKSPPGALPRPKRVRASRGGPASASTEREAAAGTP